MSISGYLDGLFGSSAPGSASSSDVSSWNALIDEYEAGPRGSSADYRSYNRVDDEQPIDPQYIITTPWPSILDNYPHAGPSRPRRFISPPLTPQSSDYAGQTSHSGSTNLVALANRLRNHLSVGSSLDSLYSVLISPRSDEDIQLELVEILGFEGPGLQLVEEVLRPGNRAALVDELGDSLNGQKSGRASRQVNGNGYLPSARLAVNASKGRDKKQKIDITGMIGTSEDIERRIQEQLERPKAMFSEDGPRIVEEEVLPNVYTSSGKAPKAMSMGGRFALPEGTSRQIYDNFEEVVIPPSRPVPPKRSERPVKIGELPPLAKGCFPNYVTLNRMQSIVQPTAMNTNENMLICAPTGAGKTDVAIMSIIRVLTHYVQPGPSTHPSGFNINRDAFKVIYVAPMKALAAEITRKFGKRLAWLGIKVRELTGDMQLTRQEINETQIIVTTPEKWDVVTRKPTGEGEFASKVRLLIIDEVHLLNEDRGAVIETIVARTLRQVESSQSLIRIVGLSATLPNYRDVSDFLRVNPYQGLFFFDASFRPVPLEQHFIGVAGKPRSQASIRNMDQTVFDKVSELVQDGHQVMVFVHARKETVKSAQKLLEMAKDEGMVSFFENREHPKFDFYRRDISSSRNKEMKELFDAGFGIHHAGMLRSDRNMMERMFEDNAIKVLCCTSTLAWGVNLPAHAVVIKGTQVYDSGKGSFVDLSVLDVLQIFGRAGRPGYETSGVGYICTTQDKLEHYLYSIMAQHPIESKFIPGMIDSLNAEISLGTIANVQEAIQWLGYTYLFVRMRKEPFIYGMPHDEPRDDPQLGNKRNELIVQAARQLSVAKMIRFDEIANAFQISDLGRIAAKYYLRYQTMEVFNTMFNAHMKNADLFAMLSQATEFEQIQIRENEIPELTAILESDHCPMEVKGGVTNKHGKVNILLQAHISKVYLEDFALVSDAAYVAQNAARIIRALLEIALSRNWANNAMLLIDLSKAIEQRMWPYEHPLAQLNQLQKETMYNLRQWADDTEISELRSMEAKDIGDMIRMNEKHGQAIRDAALSFPTVSIEYALRPLSHDLLEISVHVEPQFQWNSKISGGGEPFYIWIQDEDGINILQWRSILIRSESTSFDIDFTIPIGETIPNLYTIVSVSDRWLGSDDSRVIPLDSLVMPSQPENHTQLLDIPYLNISCFNDTALEQAYKPFISTLNSLQSHAFWSAYHTQNNMLLSSPIASGKSFIGEVAIWHAYKHEPDAVVLVIVPHRRMIIETVARIRSITPKSKGISVKGMASPSDLETMNKSSKTIAVTTPSMLVQLDGPQIMACLRTPSLFLLEDLHLLDEMYELAIARILSVARPAKTRVVGLTSSINDPTDLASWLGVEPGWSYSFYPRDRGNPIVVSIKTFTLPHSATLLKAMVKPAYDIVKLSSTGTIIFVPSRSVCRTVAKDMVTQSGTEMDLNGFLAAPREDVEPLLTRLKDESLHEPLLHGIGYLIPGSAPTDLALVLELYASGILRALIVPRESCWTLPVRASTVVLMGAQYVQMIGPDRSERRVVPYSRTELVKMQGFAVQSASHLASGGRIFVMCQSEQGMTISRVLNDGLPLESSFPALLKRTAQTTATTALGRMIKYRQPPPPPQVNRRRIADLRKRDLMDLIGWTYFSKRVMSNPTFYDIHKKEEADGLSRLVDDWFRGSADEYGPVPSVYTGSSASASRAGTFTESARSRSESMSTSVTRETGVANGTTGRADVGEMDKTENMNGEEGKDSWAGGGSEGDVGGWGVAAPPA